MLGECEVCGKKCVGKDGKKYKRCFDQEEFKGNCTQTFFCLKCIDEMLHEAITKARESECEKTRTETAKEIFEKLENAFETILGYDAKGEDVICWEKFVKIRDAIQKNKKETETKVSK